MKQENQESRSTKHKIGCYYGWERTETKTLLWVDVSGSPFLA